MSNPFEEPSAEEENLNQDLNSKESEKARRMASMKRHNFQWHNYKRPTFCAHCGNLLVGVIKQGMRCKRCEVDVHDKCQEDLDKACIELIVGQHNFREKTYKQPTYCDYCTKLLVGLVNQGVKCSECGTNVHEKCQDKIEANCQQTQSRIKRGKLSRHSTRSKAARGGGGAEGRPQSIRLETVESTSRDQRESPAEADTLFATMPGKTKTKLDSPVVARKTTPMGSPAPSPRSSRSQSMTPEAATSAPAPLSPAAPSTSQPSKLQQAQVLVDDVVDIMTENVKKMNERGEKLENLKDNAEQLEEKANLFEKKAKEIKKKMWFKNYKMWIILIIAAIIIIAIIVISVVLSQKKK